jgi:hypothetical protein
MRLEREFLPVNQCYRGLLGALAVDLAFFWAVDTLEEDFVACAIDQAIGTNGKLGHNIITPC